MSACPLCEDSNDPPTHQQLLDSLALGSLLYQYELLDLPSNHHIVFVKTDKQCNQELAHCVVHITSSICQNQHSYQQCRQLEKMVVSNVSVTDSYKLDWTNWLSIKLGRVANNTLHLVTSYLQLPLASYLQLLAVTHLQLPAVTHLQLSAVTLQFIHSFIHCQLYSTHTGYNWKYKKIVAAMKSFVWVIIKVYRLLLPIVSSSYLYLGSSSYLDLHTCNYLQLPAVTFSYLPLVTCNYLYIPLQLPAVTSNYLELLTVTQSYPPVPAVSDILNSLPAS